jgi:hypothetical protein
VPARNTRTPRWRRIARDYSLGIVLGGMFLLAWVAQAVTGWQEFKSEQASHGEPANVFAADGYIWSFLEATFENWQSEFLQLLTFVVLTTYLIYKNSHESRDGQDEMQATIDRIEQQLKAIEGKQEKRRAG